MAQYMADILEPEDKDRLHDNLLVGTAKVLLCVIVSTLLQYCTDLSYLIGSNGDIPDSISMGFSQISLKTTITQYS